MRTRTFTFLGEIPSKKNSKQIFRNSRTGTSFITSSKSFKSWNSISLLAIKNQFKDEIFHKAKVTIIFTFKTKRKCDLTNKAESIMDLLVDAGVLEDDNHFVVPEVVLKGQYTQGLLETKATVIIEEIE